MAFVLVAILTTLVIGLPVTLAIDRSARGAALLGLSYLYGAGAVFGTLLILSVVHVRWSAAAATGMLVAFSAAMWGVVLIGKRHSTAEPAVTHWSWPAVAIDFATAWSLVSYTMYASIARVWSWDFWAIWGLKARVFVENGGIDWRYLQSPFNDFEHPDYPLLVPMNYAYAALISGGWDDRWMGLVWMAFTVAVVLIFRSLAARELPELFAALAGFTAAGVAFTRHVGLADAALVAFATAAVLMIRRYLLFDEPAALRHGAILLGLAASTKNEGLALIATVVMAILIDRFAGTRPAERAMAHPSTPAAARTLHAIVGLWPAVAIALPWFVIREVAHLHTDIARGSFVARALERLPAVVPIVAGLLGSLPDPWICLFLLIGVVLMTRDDRAGERFTFAVVTIQLFWYVATYFGTPLDVAFHIETSWPRVARHVQLPLLFIVIVALAQALPRRQTLAHAEARSDLH